MIARGLSLSPSVSLSAPVCVHQRGAGVLARCLAAGCTSPSLSLYAPIGPNTIAPPPPHPLIHPSPHPPHHTLPHHSNHQVAHLHRHTLLGFVAASDSKIERFLRSCGYRASATWISVERCCSVRRMSLLRGRVVPSWTVASSPSIVRPTYTQTIDLSVS